MHRAAELTAQLQSSIPSSNKLNSYRVDMYTVKVEKVSHAGII